MDSLLFHPKIVHLPIALGVLMPLLASGLLLAWWRGWLPRRAWIIAVAFQGILLLSGVLALRTGEADEERVEAVVAERAIEAHEEAAEAFVWGSGGVLLLMLIPILAGGRRFAVPVAAAAVLGTVVVLGLGYRTGQAGGSLVYEHGAAQAYAAGSNGAAGQGPIVGGHDNDDDDD
jgi:hypothetical protein